MSDWSFTSKQSSNFIEEGVEVEDLLILGAFQSFTVREYKLETRLK